MKQMVQFARERTAPSSANFLFMDIPRILGTSFRNKVSCFDVMFTYDLPLRTDKQLDLVPTTWVFS